MNTNPVKPRAWLPLALSVLLGILYALLLYFSETDSEVGGVYTIVRYPFRLELFYAMFVSAAVCFFVAIGYLMKKQKMGWLLLAMTIASPVVFIITIFSEATSHQDLAVARDTDGTEYHLLGMAFLQGSEVVIGKLMYHGQFKEEFQVLAQSSWESSMGCLDLVRPEGSTKERNLFLTANRMLVGVPSYNRAFLAYDLKSGQAYSQSSMNRRLISELSPFMLLGPTDKPNQKDFQALLDPKSYGRPDTAAIKGDLQNPNAQVRDMADKLAKDLAKHPPLRL